MAGVKGKSGPPGHRHSVGNAGGPGGMPGNANAVKHGLHSFLATGRLPKGASYVKKLLAGYRAAVEAAVIDQHGEIGLYHASVVQSCIRHEARAQLLLRYLRLIDNAEATEAGRNAPPKSIDERVKLLKEIGAATDRRDACLKELGIHLPPPDPTTGPVVWQPPEPAEAIDPPVDDAASRTARQSPATATAEPWTTNRTAEAANVPACDAEKACGDISNEGSSHE